MVILVVLAVFFGIFLLVKHRIGPTQLAIIAGLSVYDSFGNQFANFLHNFFQNISTEHLASIVFLLFVVIFPLVLYFRSHKGGLFGVFRIAASAVLATLLATLIAPILAGFFTFDTLSADIVGFFNSIRNTVVLISIIIAYFDILFYKD